MYINISMLRVTCRSFA
jgi:hypothetical protein